MADILLKGGKMLNRSCPECNAPLFQQEGRTFCARCQWEEGKPKAEGSEPPPESTGDVKRDESPETDNAVLEALRKLEMAVLGRIHEYAGRLEDRKEDTNLSVNLQALGDLLDLLGEIMELEARAKAEI